MRYFPPIACALLFALPAKADKFWFSDPAAQKDAVANSLPDCLEGVLLSEDADGYHVRVVGGELVLPKKLVFKVEKDGGMTVDTIVKAEKAAAEALALANKERELQQQIARKERELKAAEASAHKGGKPVDASMQSGPVVAPAPFDPVLGVAEMGRGDVLRQAQVAFEQTRDRDYLKALRQLRRLR